jgi:hypothetical protein
VGKLTNTTLSHSNMISSFSNFLFSWYWGLNSGPHTC